jgi:integrase
VFGSLHAEAFVRYLRVIEVAPNGHPRARKRRLLDKGIRFILEACRAMFRFAVKRRHLSPYFENPFTELDLDRLPIDNAKPIQIFTVEQERQFLEACDDWQFPLFLTLMLTGMRPGELMQLLLPEDLDLDAGVLRVRNKPRLHWQVKTRNERDIPLVAPLLAVLRFMLNGRTMGPVFLRRRFANGEAPVLGNRTAAQLERDLEFRIEEAERQYDGRLSRAGESAIARTVWRDAGFVKTDRIRLEFMRLTERLGLPEFTAPKALRHGFATCLQDGNVDPLIRCELMGHAVGARSNGHGLGMTAAYTHTRPETKRDQVARALLGRASVAVAVAWLRPATSSATPSSWN